MGRKEWSGEVDIIFLRGFRQRVYFFDKGDFHQFSEKILRLAALAQDDILNWGGDRYTGVGWCGSGFLRDLKKILKKVLIFL